MARRLALILLIAFGLAACTGDDPDSSDTEGDAPIGTVESAEASTVPETTGAEAGDEPDNRIAPAAASLASVSASDYVVFAQAQSDDSDFEAAFSGSSNDYFGRVHSNNNTESNGSDECFYYPGGPSPAPAFTYGGSH